MSRILFILVLLVVGYLLLKSFQRKKDQYHLNKKKDSGRLSKNTQIVRCEHCALHVPEPDAVKHGGKFFCSLEHAQQAQLNNKP
jgi:uncharacterized protein